MPTEGRISQAGVTVVQQPSAPDRRVSQAGIYAIQKNATFDAATTATIAGTNTATFSHTVCTLDDRILLVFASSEDDTDSTDGVVTGITYGGVALTKIRHEQINIVAVSCNRIEAWYLVAPATGANNVIVSFTGNVTGGIVAALSYYDIDQTSPINANNGTADAVGAAGGSVTVTSTVDNCVVVDGIHGYASGTTITVDPSQTQRAAVALAGVARQAGSDEIKASAGACVMSWTFSAPQCYVQVGVALAPVAAAGPTGVKTINDLAIASVKTINDLVIASVKTIMG